MNDNWKRLDRHGLSSEPGQPVLMSATIDKLDEYADRIEELEVKLAKAVEALESSTKEHHVIAGMDLMSASAVAYNAAQAGNITLAELKGEADG